MGLLGVELIVHRLDLDMTAAYKRFFDFAANRRPECYGLITERRAAGPSLAARGDSR